MPSMPNKKTMKRKMKEGNPRIYYSSTEVRAVSNDGGKKWHVDAKINGKKRHANLTKHDIMDVLAYPASPKDLRTRLLEDFDMGPRDVRNDRNTRKIRNRNRKNKVKV